MNSKDVTRLIFGKDIEVAEKVMMKMPTVEEVALSDNFGKYTSIFTIRTRELFSSLPDVDALEKRFPTVWSMMFDPKEEGDLLLGRALGSESTASNIFIEALSFWTNLRPEGFVRLANGKKFVHEGVDWIIDVGEYNRLSKLIKDVIGYVPSDHFVAPKNMNPNRFSHWEGILKGRLKQADKNKRTIADKILILSVSTETYIPIESIGKMSYYQFQKLYSILEEKEAYKHRWDVKISPKFEDKKNNSTKHWKEAFKLIK